MKKLLGLLLVMTMAWPVSANVLDNVDVIGEIEAIGAENNLGTTAANGAASRVMAGLSAELTEDVRANVQFVYGTEWTGDEGSTLQEYWETVQLAEANIVLSNLFDCFEVTVGRQFYGDENSAVMYFGPRHGYMAALADVSSLDAAKLTYSDDFKAVTLIAGKTKRFLNTAADGATIFGADIALNLSDLLKAQIYGYALKDNTWIPDGEEYQGFYGAKLSLTPEAGLLSVEYARAHDGNRLIKESHDNAYMVKVDGALNLDAFTPRAAFFYQKGTVSHYGAYAPGLVYSKTRFGDMLYQGLEESRIFNVGVDYAWDKWTFSLDGFAFQDRTAQHEATLEADLTANYQHNENVGLFAGIGYAKLGGDYGDFNQPDATVYQAGVNVKF
ncbi:MAG TPA: hypothetical protein IAB21_01025 [Candidatus Avelusimicrobium excrementipullorum]|nr:hypothetical protein [Candidatus Avelusimicrobium excrementipullorum]